MISTMTEADEMRQRLARLVALRRRADQRRTQRDQDIDAVLPDAVQVLDVVEVAKIVGMTPPGLYKRLDRIGVTRPKRGEQTKETEQ